ncbi:MAG: DUF120 domain-containing protein, partial [Candidatus Nezhaarchaeales archaeon]
RAAEAAARTAYQSAVAAADTVRKATIDAAVLLIERTHYGRDTIEIIAPINLRQALKLKDGDKVSVEVQLI